MTDAVVLSKALPRAEELLRELRAIREELGSAAGAAPMDAVDGLAELVRRMRFILREAEESDDAFGHWMPPFASVGIVPYDLVLPPPPPPWGGPWRTAPASGCYEASWGWVHVRPGCRCPR